MAPRHLGDLDPSDRPQPSPICVLKLGGSVLDASDGLSVAVYAIYRELRRGRRVLAVVSAFRGVTDELLDKARRRFGRPQPAALASLLSTAETASWYEVLRLGGRLVQPKALRFAAEHEALRRTGASGKRIKLPVRAQRANEGIQAEVGPVALPSEHGLTQAHNEDNRVLIHLLDEDPILLHGKGAGRWPTSLGVVADLLELHEWEGGAPGSLPPRSGLEEVRT